MSGAVHTLPAAPTVAARGRRLSGLLFGNPANIAITLACLLFLAWTMPPLVRWAVIDATWTGSADACRAGGGACWAFIGAKMRFILFGLYPPEGDGRATAASLLLVGLVVASAWPRLWRRELLAAWVAVPVAVIALMMGGWGDRAVPTDKWGGLPLTLILTVFGLAAAFPVSVLLALGRRSRMGILRTLCVGVIEVTRGVPMIAVLYVAILLFPLMLPSGSAVDKLARAQVGIILFVAAYMAEIVRSGLQAIPEGQYEAAKALGLSYWGLMRLVVLPQALRLVIPGFVNLAIGLFLDTTLVIVIGAFDFLNTARTAATDTEWLGFYDEAFAFVGLVYLVVCLIGSRYSLWLERRFARGTR